MKAALTEIWTIIKTVGLALKAGFGPIDIGSTWADLKEFAADTFGAITGWIIQNKDTFIAWGYYIAQIARTAWNLVVQAATAAFDLLKSAWNAVMGAIWKVSSR